MSQAPGNRDGWSLLSVTGKMPGFFCSCDHFGMKERNELGLVRDGRVGKKTRQRGDGELRGKRICRHKTRRKGKGEWSHRQGASCPWHMCVHRQG